MKNSKKQSGLKEHTGLLLASAAAVALCAVTVIFMGQNGGRTVLKNNSSSGAQSTAQNLSTVTIAEGEALRILTAEVTETASFYPIEVDGTQMEIIAVRDSSGNIRTAFNTCQICYASGRGYYVQQGNLLVCQNCGNRFTVDEVEIESGGCNPWPIFASHKTVTDEYIEISYDFLAESEKIFSNWKISY